MLKENQYHAQKSVIFVPKIIIFELFSKFVGIKKWVKVTLLDFENSYLCSNGSSIRTVLALFLRTYCTFVKTLI